MNEIRRTADGAEAAIRPTTRLRQLLQEPSIVVAPGAHDALTARLIAAQGFRALYMGGSGTTAAAGTTGHPALRASRRWSETLD